MFNNQKNQHSHRSGEEIRIQQEYEKFRHSARRARPCCNPNILPFISRSQQYEERQLSNMMAGQDAVYRRQTQYTPSQKHNQIVRPVPLVMNDPSSRLHGQSSRRSINSFKNRLERHELAQAFQALRGHGNVGQDSDHVQQIRVDTQLYYNGQNLVKPQPYHFEPSPSYEQGHSSPVETVTDIDGLDTRLLSCIAQVGSESPWYGHQGEKGGALTPNQIAEMMDDYQETQRSVRTMKSCDSSGSVQRSETKAGNDSQLKQKPSKTQIQYWQQQTPEQVQNLNTQIEGQSEHFQYQSQYSQIQVEALSPQPKASPLTMSFSSANVQQDNIVESEQMPQIIEISEEQPRVVFETIREIGDGMHANIYLAQKSLIMQDQVIDKQFLCVKVFKPYADSLSKGCADEEYRVGQILRGHPNVITINSFEKQQPITIDGVVQVRDYLTLDFCENSDLFSFMSNYGKRQVQSGAKKAQGQGLLVRDRQLLISICAQLIGGLSALHHQAGFAHMDIKLENILIADDGSLKFCDFGFATPLNSFINKKMGTPVYMAPEIHQAAEMPCKAQPTDIFSLGVLFFMLAFGAPPFHAAVNTDCYFSYLVLKPGNTDFFKYHPHTRQLFRDKKIPQSFMDLLIAMLMVEPARRIQDVGQLLEFEFLKSELSESMDLNDVMKQAVTELMQESADLQEIKHED